MIFAHAYDAALHSGILHQGPSARGSIDEQAELCAINTALADPDGYFPILFPDQGLHYFPERAAGHWFLAFEPLARLCRQTEADQSQEHEFSHRNPLY